jgi:hypothetical protein
MSVKFLISVLCAFILFSGPHQAWGEKNDDQDKIYGFADSLFKEGDYYRAITEYKRFIFNSPNDALKTENAYFRIGESYFGAKRWEEAINSFNQFLTLYPQSPKCFEALNYKGIAEKNQKKNNEAIATFNLIIEKASGEIRNRALFESALVFVEMEDWNQAKDLFSRIPEDSVLHTSARRFSAGLAEIDNMPRKSPAVAGTLAAILPGSGHLYTERPRDALVAFILNASFIWAAIELFNHENYAAGGIVTFFEIGWYAGNIYSAVSSAHKYNERIKNEHIQSLKEKSGISLFPGYYQGTRFVMVGIRF